MGDTIALNPIFVGQFMVPPIITIEKNIVDHYGKIAKPAGQQYVARGKAKMRRFYTAYLANDYLKALLKYGLHPDIHSDIHTKKLMKENDLSQAKSAKTKNTTNPGTLFCTMQALMACYTGYVLVKNDPTKILPTLPVTTWVEGETCKLSSRVFENYREVLICSNKISRNTYGLPDYTFQEYVHAAKFGYIIPGDHVENVVEKPTKRKQPPTTDTPPPTYKRRMHDQFAGVLPWLKQIINITLENNSEHHQTVNDSMSTVIALVAQEAGGDDPLPNWDDVTPQYDT